MTKAQEALGVRVGQRVREIRIRRGMTQGKLAEAAGLHVSAIKQLESGKVRGVPRGLARIAAALGVTEAVLMQEPGGYIPRRSPQRRERAHHESGFVPDVFLLVGEGDAKSKEAKRAAFIKYFESMRKLCA